ncbi:hypothetical protein [Streptomyces sp. NPDC059783]|uniref:hypothetical protein n=1 Tax=Streptomyces sp. NPDC059783 TaxID=3346944 RepID=UPI00364F99AB
MGKQKHYTTEKDLKTLNRQLGIGDRVYGVVEIERRMSPWEDGQLYVERTVTGRCWVTQQWQVDRSTLTVADMVHSGGVYTEPPAGLRNLAGPGPQVAGPLPAGTEFGRPLNKAEIEALEAQAAGAAKDNAKAGRGKSSRWW